MHPNAAFAWTDKAEMLRFVSEQSFAHIFTSSDAGQFVVHAPVVVRGGNIQFHVSRRNRIAEQLDGSPVLISVLGRHAYHSANWYASDNQVSTWHYEAVEIEGMARRLSDEDLVSLIDQLSDTMEQRYSPEQPWTRAKMGPGKFEAMTKAIVGFEVEPSEIRGTRKFNQTKSGPDLEASIAGQRRAGREDIAAAIEELRPVSNRLAIFDCDGTLVDSGANIYAALTLSLERNGLEVPPPEVCRRIIGLSLVEAIATLLPDLAPEQHVQLAEDYKAAFMEMRSAGRIEEPLFEGVLELLDALEDDGWLLAVATGKSDRGLKHCLDTHGIHARFISLQTADRHPSKPHPSMVEQAIADAGAVASRTIVVGDTSFDMAMAVNAGAAGIGAAWGYHEAVELIEAGAVAIAETPRDVLAVVRSRIDG